MAFIQGSICPAKVEQFITHKPLQLWGKAEQCYYLHLTIKEKKGKLHSQIDCKSAPQLAK